MDIIVTTSEAATLLHTSRDRVARKCRLGDYRFVVRDGGRWLINLSREFPELFGSKERASRDVPTNVTALKNQLGG